MSTKSFTPDHDADYSTREIERYYDEQDRSARRRRWLLGAGVAVAGLAAALTFMSSSSTPAAPAGTSTSTVSPAVPSSPGASAANPAAPSSPAQGTGASAG